MTRMAGDSRQSRRRFLQATGTAAAVGLAGCLDSLPFARTNPDNFPYAPGFTQDSIELEQALGPTSPMASVSSLHLASTRDLSFPFGEIAVALEGQFDQTTERFQTRQRRQNSIESRFVIQDQYFNSTELFERIRIEPRALDFNYRARSYDFGVESEYRLRELHDLLTDIDLSATDVHTPEETPLAVYSASIAEFGTHSIVQQWRDSIGAFESGAIHVHVDPEGLIHLVTAELSYLNQEDDEVRIATDWAYSEFEALEVEPPEWFQKVPDRERPEVEVAFDETPGEAVEVRVESIANTSEVAVVVRGEGVVAHFEEPDTISIEADQYTSDEGDATALLVFAQNNLRGPVQVGFHQPEQAAADSTQ